MLETPSQALVLTAGLGTRLRPLTYVRAKPAIPVAGEPLIRRIIAWLAGRGIRDLVLNLHHLPETLTAVVGDGADLDARVRYSWEQPVVLGSAGGPHLALPLIAAYTFFIVNGDTITDVDPRSVFRSHAASGARVPRFSTRSAVDRATPFCRVSGTSQRARKRGRTGQGPDRPVQCVVHQLRGNRHLQNRWTIACGKARCGGSGTC